MPLQIRASLACKLAGLDRDRFNEAVAREDYRCAPMVIGRTRIFSIPQVITLAIYRYMTEDNMPTRKAGYIACAMTGEIEMIERIRFDDSDSTLNGILLKEYFAEERKSGTLETVGVAVIKTSGGYEYKITANDKALRDKLEKSTLCSISSPMASNWGMPVINQQNWLVGNIRADIMRGIENYRNTLGEEDAIG